MDRPNCCNAGLYDKDGIALKAVPLKEISVHADMRNLVANVTCSLVYKNESKDLVETLFVFPMDADSAIYHFEAEIGKKILVATCRKRVEAMNTYQEAVDTGHSAFYMEEDELMGDTLGIKVGNIPPTETAVIRIHYFCRLRAQNVTDDSGDRAMAIFTLPSVLNPRYMPPSSKCERQFGPSNANQVCRVNASYKFSFSANLSSQCAISAVTSVKDVFELEYQRKDKKMAMVTLQSDFKFDHDLEMEIVFGDPTKLMVIYEEGDSRVDSGILALDCLTVNFLPMFKDGSDTRSEVIFLIDRSGSMAGSKILQAKECLLLLLKSLPTDCRFQIVGFGGTFSALPRDYTEESMEMALKYQKNLTANMGGTEVLRALESIYAKQITGYGWYRKIILLTDGDVANQPEVFSLVQRNSKTTLHFTIGIGEGASTSFVNGVARVGGGKSTFVRNNKRLQPAVLKILELALQQFVTEVELTWSVTGGAERTAMPVMTIPDQLPKIYSGTYATVVGLIENPKKLKLSGTVTLKFNVKGQTHTFSANIAEAEVSRQEGSGELSFPLHRQAAKMQILELSDTHASLEGTQLEEAARVQKQIVTLSTSANVISKFTAFVGVDPEKLGCEDVVNVVEPIPSLTKLSDGPVGGKAEAPKDILVAIAELQNLNGFWKLEADLADLLDCPLDKLVSTKPQNLAAMEDTVWATALVIAFLKTKVADRRLEWQLMSTKAQNWLATRLKSDISVDELIKKATSVLDTTSVDEATPIKPKLEWVVSTGSGSSETQNRRKGPCRLL